MEITLELIKELRAKSGAGISACKEALESSNGDMEKAMVYLREKGIAKSEKRSDKSPSEGQIGMCVHTDGKVAAMVEVMCETDFASRTEDYGRLAKDFALQVVAMNPTYLDKESVPDEIKEELKKTYKAEVEKEGKPKNIVEQIVEGKLEKYYKENCLMHQAFFKEDKLTMSDLLNEEIAKIGERVEIGRFIRFQLGEE